MGTSMRKAMTMASLGFDSKFLVPCGVSRIKVALNELLVNLLMIIRTSRASHARITWITRSWAPSVRGFPCSVAVRASAIYGSTHMVICRVDVGSYRNTWYWYV